MEYPTRPGVNPCMHAVIGASHDKMKSREAADKRIRRQAEGYKKRGSKCISYKFIRAEGEVDLDNKVLMPVEGHIPMVVHPIVTVAMLGMHVPVVGSPEVGRVIDAIKRGSRSIPQKNLERIIFVDEGDRLSLPNTISRGSAALGLPPTGRFGFMSADCPEGFDFFDIIFDPEWGEYGVIGNLNSREMIFNGHNEFSPRNYYHVLIDESGKKHHFKEPQIWQFCQEAVDNILEAAQVAYGSRNAGGVGMWEVVKMGGKRLLRQRSSMTKEQRQNLNQLLRTGIKNKLFGGKDDYVVRQDVASIFASCVFGVPAKLKATHTNPWLMRDIDARHDLWFYKLCYEHAKRRYDAKDFSELGMIHPYAREIGELEGVMKELGQEIPMIGNFAEVENGRSEEIGADKPFDDDGKLIVRPAPGEDISAAVSDLERRTLAYRRRLTKHVNDGFFPDAAVPERDPYRLGRG